MQVVHQADEFESALNLCQSRAQSAFGDSRVFVEKFIEGAQHVEFQVLADGENAIHFGERFCSIQRRHQKLLEEGPWLSDEVRAEIGERVCEGARSVGYRGLATFEFLRDKHGQFYFLEVNPRVQVEHTITEELTGIEMAMTLQTIVSSEGLQTNYVMIPRLAIKLLEFDIGVMADWIERSGYGADMNKLKKIQKDLNIVPTSLKDWLKAKLVIQNKKQNSWSRQWKSSQWKLQWDK